MIASKAAVEPIFNRLRSMVIPHMSARALAGTFIVGCTCATHLGNGRPLSRAKAKVWRLVEALKAMFEAIAKIRITMVKALTPPVRRLVRKRRERETWLDRSKRLRWKEGRTGRM